MAKEIKTRRAYKDNPDMFGIPQWLFVPGGAILFGMLALAFYAGSIDPKNQEKYLLGFGGIGVAGVGTYCMSMGKKPYRMQGLMQKQPNYVKAHLQAPDHPLQEVKIPSEVKIDRFVARPVERESQLLCMVDFQLDSQEVGGCLLRQRDQYKCIFGFEIEPIVYNRKPDEYYNIGEQLNEGLKDWPKDEHPWFVIDNFSDCSTRLAELDELITRAPTDEIKFLLEWDKARVIGLTQTNRHNIKAIRFYGTFNLGNAAYQPQDWLEKQIAGLMEMKAIAQLIKGSSVDPTRISDDEFHQMLLRSYDEGYLMWLRRLTARLGLKAVPLSAQDLWNIDSAQMNVGKVGPLPQVLCVTRHEMHWQVNDSRHITTCLFKAGIPKTDSQWIKILGTGDFVGVAVMEQIPNKDYGEPTGTSVMQQLHNAAKLLHSTHNCRIVVQLRAANQEMVQAKQIMLARQANSSMNYEARRGRVNIAGGFNHEEYTEAYRALRAGSEVINFSWVALLYRKNPLTLLRDVRGFCMNLPEGILEPEVGYVNQIWRETQPWSWNGLFMKQASRQRQDTTESVKGFIPLMLPKSRDRKGLEFIAPASKTPLYVDLFSTEKHFQIVGGTGAGKSGLYWCAIIQALANGRMTMVIDNTREGQGTGSFTEGCEFVGGANFDITRESQNIIEIPDWRSIKNEQKLENTQFLIFSNLLASLMALSVPSDYSTERREDAKTVLQVCIDKFFADEIIQKRYEHAHNCSIGTTGWQEMPVLRDFVEFMDLSLFKNLTPEIEQMFNRIRLKLSSISDPRTSLLGRSLGRPTTIDTDNPLVIYSLSSLKDNTEAAPYAVIAWTSAIIRASKYPKTLLAADECSILCKNPSIAQMMGTGYSQARKLGMIMGMAGQTIQTIWDSGSASDIINNTDIWFLSMIGSVQEFERVEGLSRHLLLEAATTFGAVDKREVVRRWLISKPKEQENWVGDLAPSFLNLALFGNSGKEKALKEEYTLRYLDKYHRYRELALHYKANSLEKHVNYGEL